MDIMFYLNLAAKYSDNEIIINPDIIIRIIAEHVTFA
jgi:hypothetical protein